MATLIAGLEEAFLSFGGVRQELLFRSDESGAGCPCVRGGR
jgi:hypothetical protein